jgi:hypothetical protein
MHSGENERRASSFSPRGSNASLRVARDIRPFVHTYCSWKYSNVENQYCSRLFLNSIGEFELHLDLFLPFGVELSLKKRRNSLLQSADML